MNIIFAGTPVLAAAILKDLISVDQIPIAVYTQPDRPAGRGQQLRPSPVKIIAAQNQLPIFQPQNIRDESVQQELAALQPDLMIVVGYGAIIPDAVLAMPKYGCINVHVSLLPRWRGAAPIQRAIQAGDLETGVTIMQMDAGLDTGPILCQLSCSITEMDTSRSIEEKLQQLGTQGLLKVIADLDYYLTHAKPQPEIGITYANKISKTEAEINWNQSANIIQHQIRAFNPAPGAYTGFSGARIKLFQSQVLDSQSGAVPGTIVQSTETQLIIATSDHDLEIVELQLPGAKRLACSDVMHSKHQYFKKGKQFESIN